MCGGVEIGKSWAIWVFSVFFVLDVVVFFLVMVGGGPCIFRQYSSWKDGFHFIHSGMTPLPVDMSFFCIS